MIDNSLDWMINDANKRKYIIVLSDKENNSKQKSSTSEFEISFKNCNFDYKDISERCESNNSVCFMNQDKPINLMQKREIISDLNVIQ
jgi:hypothetical protein